MARTALRRRWVAAKAILGQVRPVGVAGVVLTVALTVLSAWRDEWPADKQPPLLSQVLGWLPWWAWLIIALAFALVLLFEGAYREIWRVQTLAGTAPEEEPLSTAAIEKGVLDFIPDAMEAMVDFTKHLTRVAKSTREIGAKLRRHTKRIQQVAADPIRTRERAANAANDMNKHAAILEANAPVMRSCARMFGESYIAYFQVVDDAAIAAGRTKIIDFRRQIAALMKVTRDSREQGVQSYRDSVRGLRQKNLSQALNQASDRLRTALDEIVAIMKEVESSCGEMLRSIDKRLAEKRRDERRRGAACCAPTGGMQSCFVHDHKTLAYFSARSRSRLSAMMPLAPQPITLLASSRSSMPQT
jgi:hypothetical protein